MAPLAVSERPYVSSGRNDPMTTKTQFEGSRLKVQRAGRHIDELSDLFSEFLKQKFCEIVTEDDPTNGKQDHQG